MRRPIRHLALPLLLCATQAAAAPAAPAPAAASSITSAAAPAAAPPPAPADVPPADAPPAAEQFTPAQRAEIVAIVREAMKQDPSILRDAVIALQTAEGAASRQAAQTAIAREKDKLVTPADPVAGNPSGDVTIVEFFDTRCPYCRKLEPEMAQLLHQDHQIRLVYKDLPILGPASVMGTKALLAAQRQNAYEPMRAAVMQLPPDTTMPQLESVAHRLGLDWNRMQHDMQDPAIQARVDRNLSLARAIGIEGTPALVVGDDLIPGVVDLPQLQKAVRAARQ
jgi:protein-disulfide isomerase